MTIIELIQKVKDQNLTKDQLEHYRDDLAGVTAQMYLETATLEKSMAIYLDTSEEVTDAAKKRKFNVTPEGQRLLELKSYIRSATIMLSSLKSRLYNFY